MVQAMERTGLQSQVGLPPPLPTPPLPHPRCPSPLQPSKWTLPSLPVCPWSLSPRLQPLPFLSTLNLSRFWTYRYGFTPPVRCLASSSNRGRKEVPRQSLDLQGCPLWCFSQLRGPPGGRFFHGC